VVFVPKASEGSGTKLNVTHSTIPNSIPVSGAGKYSDHKYDPDITCFLTLCYDCERQTAAGFSLVWLFKIFVLHLLLCCFVFTGISQLIVLQNDEAVGGWLSRSRNDAYCK